MKVTVEQIKQDVAIVCMLHCTSENKEHNLIQRLLLNIEKMVQCFNLINGIHENYMLKTSSNSSSAIKCSLLGELHLYSLYYTL
jgi:hypothetical protein